MGVDFPLRVTQPMLRYLAVLLLALAGTAHADNSLQTDLALNYLAQVDDTLPDKPLIIFLHGSGSNEEDLFGLRDELPAEYNYLSVRGPITQHEGAYRWFASKPDAAEYDGVTTDLQRSGELLGQFIAQATEKYHSQPRKVFLIGFSQGAIMSYEVGLRHPELVGGIAALSGKVLSVLQTELKPDSARQSLAVFIGHGTLDPQLPYSGATEARVVLETLGMNPDYHAYEGMRHTINSSEMTDLNTWLQRALSRP